MSFYRGGKIKREEIERRGGCGSVGADRFWGSDRGDGDVKIASDLAVAVLGEAAAAGGTSKEREMVRGVVEGLCTNQTTLSKGFSFLSPSTTFLIPFPLPHGNQMPPSFIKQSSVRLLVVDFGHTLLRSKAFGQNQIPPVKLQGGG